MTDEKKRKKAAQAIQAMLELDGVKTTVKDVSDKIEGENLTDLMKLKDKLANDMRPATSATAGPSDRRREIGDFVVSNWNLIQDNAVIKDVLLNAYSMGRYKKEQRDTMKQELLSRVGVETEDDQEPATQEETETETTQPETENEPLDHRQYTF